jgi:branched-chain amino acid transport system substrate-binding protein
MTMAEPIRIGVSLPQSGRDARAAWGSHYNSYRLWLEQVNEQGGLLGRPVDLVVYDDVTIPAKAAENYERLIAEGVDLLFGPARSRTIEQVAPITEAAKRVLFVGHGSAHAMFQKGRKYLFLGWPGTDFDVPRSLFEWTSVLPEGRRPRRVALVAPDDRRPSYTDDPRHGINQHNTGVVLGTRHYAELLSLELVHEDVYTDDFDSYDALFERVAATRPEVILLTDYALPRGDQQLDELVRALRHRLPDVFLWLYRIPMHEGPGAGAGDRTADPRAAHQVVDPLYEGAFTYDQWDTRSPNPLARAYVDAFVRRNEYLPDNIAAGVYAACQILQQSVEGAGACEDEALRAYLLSHPFETVMGTYHFQENGVPLARQLLFQVLDGELQVVHPVEERTADPPA